MGGLVRQDTQKAGHPEFKSTPAASRVTFEPKKKKKSKPCCPTYVWIMLTIISILLAILAVLKMHKRHETNVVPGSLQLESGEEMIKLSSGAELVVKDPDLS